MARKTIEDWVSEVVLEEGGSITAIVLFHMKRGDVEVEIHTCPYVSGRKVGTPREVANMFRGKAETDCQDMVGPQVYILRAFYNGAQESKARFQFRLNGDNERFDSNGLETYQPDAKGALQQGMHLTEAIVQGTFRSHFALNERYDKIVDRLERNNETLFRENLEMRGLLYQEIEAKILKKHEQELELEKYRRSTEERKMWFKIAPPLINSIFGKEVFPLATEDTALVEMIAEKMSDGDVSKLMALNLPPTVIGPLISRFNRYMAEKKEGEERLQASIKELKAQNEVDEEAAQ